MTSAPESIDDYYARVLAATDDEHRLPVAVEAMAGWDIYPYEVESLRLKPLRPLADEEPPRRGEAAEDCWCTGPARPDDGTMVWRSERWVVHLSAETGLPIGLTLSPFAHHDLPELPADLAAEMGLLVAAISAGVEQVPSVGRAQLAKYGDGGAHLHLFFFGRPARILQFRGSPLLDWEENLPRVPLDVLQRNARVVAAHLVATVGGEAGRLGAPA